MAYTRRNTNKDATWARAWTADAYSDLASIAAILGSEGPRHGDIAYVTDIGIYFLWLDNNTWAPLYLAIPIVPAMLEEQVYSEDVVIPKSISAISGGNGGFVNGSVIFNYAGVLAQDNANFFWDNVNKLFGIGTAAPTSRVTASDNTTALPTPVSGTIYHIGGADGATVARATIDAFGGTPAISFRRANGTNASPTQLLQDNQFFNFSGFGYQSGGAYSAAARAQLTARAIENWTSTAQGAYFTFETNSAGSVASPPTTRLTVSDNLVVGAGRTSLPGAGTNGLIFADGTAPSSLASNTAGIYSEDDGTGNVRMYGVNEDGQTGPLGVVVTKSTTGDPTGYEGLFCINTFDNTFKVYADGAWRTLASGW